MATITPLGIKRTCPSCSARFYDLKKSPAVCPKCAHSFDPNAAVRKPRARRVAEGAQDSEDMLLQHMAKTKAGAAKGKRKDDEIEAFGDLESGSAEDIAEIEEIDDIEALEELDEIEDEAEAEAEGIVLEEEGASLIDVVEESEEFEEEDEESPKTKRTPKKKVKK